MSSTYDFFKANVFNTEFLLVKSLEDRTIIQLKKQSELMEERLGYNVVLLTEQLSPYKRKRLIQEKMAFISVDQQMFLPFLGLLIKDSYKKKVLPQKREKFTPLMQRVFLNILYRNKTEFTQTELVNELEISAMSASRALEQFARLKMVQYVIEGKTGRKKIYSCISKEQFYQEGSQYLINPVKERFYVDCVPEGIKTYLCGLSALSKRTMLGEPDHQILAISPEDEKYMRDYQVSDEEGIEERRTEIQVMKYAADNLTEDSILDPVSIICSISQQDERIDMAIDEMMGEYAWYVV